METGIDYSVAWEGKAVALAGFRVDPVEASMSISGLHSHNWILSGASD